MKYDREKAASVKSGYLPDPDETLRTGKGITQPEELYGYMDSLWGDESAVGIRYQVDGAGRLIQK